MDVYLELPADDPETGSYWVPEWLYIAYSKAIFPSSDVYLPEGNLDWFGYSPDLHKDIWVGSAYSTWIWADYKSAAQNPDGTWDVTVTLGTAEDGITIDKIITLAPNEGIQSRQPVRVPHCCG